MNKFFRDLFTSDTIRVEVEYKKSGETSTIQLRVEKGYVLRQQGWTIIHEIKTKMMFQEGIYDAEIVSILLI